MSDKDVGKCGTCQIQVLYDEAEGLNLRDRARLFSLRLLSAAERRLPGSWTLQTGTPANECESGEKLQPKFLETGRAGPGEIREGDLVEVMSMTEIRKTLNQKNRCQGLEFLPAMGAFCGKRFVIKKKVRTIFDERAWKMVKIKNTCLLEDGICDGKNMYDKEGCDRCCYFFWKEAWLKKIQTS